MSTRMIYVLVTVDDGLTEEQAQQQAVIRVHRALAGRTDMRVAGERRLEKAIARERGPAPKRRES